MVDAVMDLVAAPEALYATILILLTVDAFIPVVPAQALMIGGGILSTTGHVQLLLLVAAAALLFLAGAPLLGLAGRLRKRSAGSAAALRPVAFAFGSEPAPSATAATAGAADAVPALTEVLAAGVVPTVGAADAVPTA